MSTRQVRIELKAPAWETVVLIDGVAQTMIERVTLNVGASDPMGRVELTRVLTPEQAKARGEEVEYGEVPRVIDTLNGGEYDIEVEGIVQVVELFEHEARKAAEEQRVALGSFMIRESDDPAVTTLGELLRDAKRYRAVRWGVAHGPPEGTTGTWEALPRLGPPAALDAMADELREHIGRMRGDGVS